MPQYRSAISYQCVSERPHDADGVVLIAEGPNAPPLAAEWGFSPAAVQEQIQRREWKGKLGEVLVVSDLERALFLVGNDDKDLDVERGRNREVVATKGLRELAGHLATLRIRHLAVDLQTEDAAPVLKRVVQVLEMAFAKLPHFQAKDESKAPARVSVVGSSLDKALERELVLTAATNLVRGLTRLPSNTLHPDGYQALLEELAADGLEITVWDHQALVERKAGALLAVAKASPQGARVVRLRYAPSGKPLVKVVGKGVVFDTGGLSLKAPKYMLGMHDDMSGSAVAAAMCWAAAKLKLPFGVESYLGIVENLIGPEALRPGDVIRTLSGKTVEIIDTDAEGRLVLADTLTLAMQEGHPDLVIDYATLTGSCLRALGTVASGVWSNRESLYPLCLDAGYAAGERVWPFPNWPDYKLESKIADLKQCTVDGAPDMAHAFAFLNEFVPKEVPYLHVDLAAVSDDDGLGPVPAGYTGFGVRFGLELAQRLLT